MSGCRRCQGVVLCVRLRARQPADGGAAADAVEGRRRCTARRHAYGLLTAHHNGTRRRCGHLLLLLPVEALRQPEPGRTADAERTNTEREQFHADFTQKLRVSSESQSPRWNPATTACLLSSRSCVRITQGALSHSKGFGRCSHHQNSQLSRIVRQKVRQILPDSLFGPEATAEREQAAPAVAVLSEGTKGEGAEGFSSHHSFVPQQR